MLTPNDIEVLLHYHVSPSAHPRIDAPAVKNSIAMHFKNGLLSGDGYEGRFDVTDKGRAFIDMLCNTPIPVIKYVDPRFEK